MGGGGRSIPPMCPSGNGSAGTQLVFGRPRSTARFIARRRWRQFRPGATRRPSTSSLPWKLPSSSPTWNAPAPWEVTAGHVYIRGHGPTGEYKDRYPPKTLKNWAGSMARWRRQRRDVYCYFDNDQKSAAPQDARALLELTSSES